MISMINQTCHMLRSSCPVLMTGPLGVSAWFLRERAVRRHFFASLSATSLSAIFFENSGTLYWGPYMTRTYGSHTDLPRAHSAPLHMERSGAANPTFVLGKEAR